MVRYHSSMPNAFSDAERLTAYHEAGHAVMAELCGRLLTEVEILGDRDHTGSVQSLAFLPNPEAEAEDVKRHLKIILAGIVAETMVSQREDWDETSEDLDAAVRQTAEVLGCGQTTDAYHVTAPDPSGTYISLAIQKALDDAKVTAEQIDYINAHGTSTRYNDLIETRAIKQVFGNHAKKLLVSSTKSMTGHLVGACGGIEAAFCIKAMEHGIVPPTINYEVPDDELDLNYVPNTAQEHSLEYVMSNNFGFGGHNAVILFKKFS